MRIAFDHQTFTLQAYGGISRYFVRVIEELLIKEEEVGIFAPYHCNQLLSMLPQNVVFGKQISKNDFNKPTALALLVANQILASKKIKKWEPSIFHETYYSFKKRTHNKYVTVITVYDMIHEKFPFYFSKLDPTSFLKRDAINRADHIICISTSTKNDLLEIFPSVRDKVSVVHLGVSLFKTLNSTVSISRPYLFYVGSRNGHKNFTNFLTSFANSKKLNSEFDIIAFGGGSFTRNEYNLMKEIGLKEEQIKHVSGNDDMLALYYKNATAFIYPSIYEGFGLPPLEAMAQGCPVVSSNSSSMPEVIGNAGEYFDPFSNEQISAAIENVVFSNSRRNELIELGQKRLGLFTWQNCANETHRIYRELAGVSRVQTNS